jgi:hypothetical protein
MVFVLLTPAQQMLVKIAEGHFEEKKNTICRNKKEKTQLCDII